MRFNPMMLLAIVLAAGGEAPSLERHMPRRRPDPLPKRFPPKPPIQLHAMTPRQLMRKHHRAVERHANELRWDQNRRLVALDAAEMKQDHRLRKVEFERKRALSQEQREHEARIKVCSDRRAKLQSNRERKARRNKRARNKQ